MVKNIIVITCQQTQYDCCETLTLYEERSGLYLAGSNSSGFSNTGWEGSLSSAGSKLHLEWTTDNTDADVGFVVTACSFFTSILGLYLIWLHVDVDLHRYYGRSKMCILFFRLKSRRLRRKFEAAVSSFSLLLYMSSTQYYMQRQIK